MRPTWLSNADWQSRTGNISINWTSPCNRMPQRMTNRRGLSIMPAFIIFSAATRAIAILNNWSRCSSVGFTGISTCRWVFPISLSIIWSNITTSLRRARKRIQISSGYGCRSISCMSKGSSGNTWKDFRICKFWGFVQAGCSVRNTSRFRTKSSLQKNGQVFRPESSRCCRRLCACSRYFTELALSINLICWSRRISCRPEKNAKKLSRFPHSSHRKNRLHVSNDGSYFQSF